MIDRIMVLVFVAAALFAAWAISWETTFTWKWRGHRRVWEPPHRWYVRLIGGLATFVVFAFFVFVIFPLGIVHDFVWPWGKRWITWR